MIRTVHLDPSLPLLGILTKLVGRRLRDSGCPGRREELEVNMRVEGERGDSSLESSVGRV